jgi:type I restriction enzyme, S subunit
VTCPAPSTKLPDSSDAEDKIRRDAISGSAARIVGPNSVLAVVRSGILAHTFPVATIARDVSFNQDIKAITPKNGSLLPSYLFWMLKGQEAQILRIGVKKGATVHSLSNGFLEALRFPLPPLDEQRRIVGLLDRAAEIRRRADDARAKARIVIPSLFLDTFGDPASNTKGWQVVALGNHADVQGGVQVSAKRATLPVELPYLRVANVMRGDLNLSEIKLIRVTAAEAQRTCLARGDVLIVEGHGNPNEIGRAAVWDGSIAVCTHQNHLIRARPDRCCLTPEYLETFLNSDVGRRILIQNGKTTSGLNTISTRNVKDVAFPLPPIALQTVFAEQVHRLEMLARHLDAAAAKAEAMAAALSAEVFDQRCADGRPSH